MHLHKVQSMLLAHDFGAVYAVDKWGQRGYITELRHVYDVTLKTRRFTIATIQTNQGPVEVATAYIRRIVGVAQ
jgi:hypothetical protein